jgi:hypothetical protein
MEPVRVAAFVRVVLYAVAFFGVHPEPEVATAIILVVESAFALWTRQQVVPVAKIEPLIVGAAYETAAKLGVDVVGQVGEVTAESMDIVDSIVKETLK